MGHSIWCGPFEPVGSLDMSGPFEPVGPFDMVGPFKPVAHLIWSIEPVAWVNAWTMINNQLGQCILLSPLNQMTEMIHLLGLFERVGSFDMVGPFEPVESLIWSGHLNWLGY